MYLCDEYVMRFPSDCASDRVLTDHAVVKLFNPTKGRAEGLDKERFAPPPEFALQAVHSRRCLGEDRRFPGQVFWGSV